MVVPGRDGGRMWIWRVPQQLRRFWHCSLCHTIGLWKQKSRDVKLQTNEFDDRQLTLPGTFDMLCIKNNVPTLCITLCTFMYVFQHMWIFCKVNSQSSACFLFKRFISAQLPFKKLKNINHNNIWSHLVFMWNHLWRYFIQNTRTINHS